MAYEPIIDTTWCEICRDCESNTNRWGTRLCHYCHYLLDNAGHFSKEEGDVYEDEEDEE